MDWEIQVLPTSQLRISSLPLSSSALPGLSPLLLPTLSPVIVSFYDFIFRVFPLSANVRVTDVEMGPDYISNLDEITCSGLINKYVRGLSREFSSHVVGM